MAYPSYIDAFKSGTLKARTDKIIDSLKSCAICPRQCKVDRLKNKQGFCRTGKNAIACSYFPHHGEEPAISGTNGSGAIFFSRCNMRCLYCQNYDFSQKEEGREVTAEELSDYMLELQSLGCHNVNFVTPTHVMPQILEALCLAAEKGLKLPIVYNTSGYELPEIIKLLDGIVDIYLPDMRYGKTGPDEKYSSAPGYPRHNQDCIMEMFRQVGVGEFDENGIIRKGLIIRHLVLPKNLAATDLICSFIAKELSKKVHISLMSQYEPYFKAEGIPGLDRRITLQEYEEAQSFLKKYGLENGWIQESGGLRRFAGTNIKRNV